MSDKYNRTYHLRNSPGTTSDDRIAKSALGLLKKRIIITEKLDGGNIDFVKDGVYARSHAIFTENPWDEKMWEIHNDIKDFIGDLEIFGENMWAVHTIEYQKVRNFFYMFAIRYPDKSWASWKDIEETAYLLDLPTVPVLWDGQVETEDELYDIVDRFTNPEYLKNGSKLGGEVEGVVVRQYDGFYNEQFSDVVQKWVRAKHVKTDEHWTKMWRQGRGKKHQIYWEY